MEQAHAGEHPAEGPKYFVDIEGEIFEWPDGTITTEEIAAKGGWDVAQGVLEIDLQTNTQRQLAPNETVEIKPGKGFAKKFRWQRG